MRIEVGLAGGALRRHPEQQREHRCRLGTVQPRWGTVNAAIIGWRYTAIMGWYSAVIMVWGPCSCDPMLKKMGCSPGGKERDAHVPPLGCESNTSFQLQNWCVLTGM